MTTNWFITGSSRGFGRRFVERALERGDNVVATARNVGALDELLDDYPLSLLVLELDVTDRDAVFECVAEAHDWIGRIDVVVNNAGYGLFGTVEELSDAQARTQMDTNFFGALAVTQAVLPILRAQRSGHIIQISSIGGVCAFPALGGYHASKWALEGLSESLAQEVAGLGIKVTLVEPGSYDTDWAGTSAVNADRLPAYAPLHEALDGRSAASAGGDPDAAATAMLAIVDSEQPPLRALLGSMAYDIATNTYQQRLAGWAAHEVLSRTA